MKYILFDCDNTFGLENCDLDDGIALLYLLGRERLARDIRLVGISTTYGNGSLAQVNRATERLLRILGREDIPVFCGREAEPGRGNGVEAKAHIGSGEGESTCGQNGVWGESQGRSGEGEKSACGQNGVCGEAQGSACKREEARGRNSAAEAILSLSECYGQDFYVLATGSMTNVGEAAVLAARRGQRPWRRLVLMGGITAPLVFKKAVMSELNLSCNHSAALALFEHGGDIAVLSANNCLAVQFSLNDYEDTHMRAYAGGQLSAINLALQQTARAYYGYNDRVYGLEGFIHWDLLAAQYLCEPTLFEEHMAIVHPSPEELSRGFLRPVYMDKAEKGERGLANFRESGSGSSVISLPTVVSQEAVRENAFRYIFAN